MTPGSQHPLRCETCGNFKPGTSGGESGMGSCVKSKRVITWQQWCIIRDVGCASHTAASEQEIRASGEIMQRIIGTLTITEGFVPTAIRSEVMRLREELSKMELRRQNPGGPE